MAAIVNLTLISEGESQTILPIVGDSSLYCIYGVDGKSQVVRASNTGFNDIAPGKEIKKLKKKQKAKNEILKKVRKELSGVPKTDRFEAKRTRLESTLNRLKNEVDAQKAIQTSLINCQKNIPLQPQFIKIVLIDSVNVAGERVIATIGIRQRVNFTCGKGCSGFIAGGSWCATFTSSGEIPYNGTSGKEVQVLFYEGDKTFNSIQPNAQQKIVADDEIWTPLFQSTNPPNPTDATNQVVARTGDLSITSRPISGRPCGS